MVTEGKNRIDFKAQLLLGIGVKNSFPPNITLSNDSHQLKLLIKKLWTNWQFCIKKFFTIYAFLAQRMKAEDSVQMRRRCRRPHSAVPAKMILPTNRRHAPRWPPSFLPFSSHFPPPKDRQIWAPR